MSLSFPLAAIAVLVLPASLSWAQDPTPTPVEPVPVRQARPKQDKPAPVADPARQEPAKKKVVDAPEAKGETGAQETKKAQSRPAKEDKTGKDTTQSSKKVAKKTGKKYKKDEKAEPGEMKKVTISVDTKDVKDVEDVPVPEGANEADIRAIRGANAMLKAEKQLKQILKNLKVKGDAIPVPFKKIDSWTYEDGFKGMPKDIRKLDGKRVVMAGFMLPIYEVENIKTFYLVKSLWSCCYGIPPDVNGLVHVVVKKKGGVNYQYDPIFIVGHFKVKEIKDEDYTVCLFEIVADDIRVLDLKIK